jgi:hypothetical protein
MLVFEGWNSQARQEHGLHEQRGRGKKEKVVFERLKK